MDKPVTFQESRNISESVFWSLTALAISVFVLLRVGYVLREFYLYTSTLAAGTGIRPMGVTLHLGIASIACILVGGICAFFAGIVALNQRRWRLVTLAGIVGVSTWIPMFVSKQGFDYVVEIRKLVLEP